MEEPLDVYINVDKSTLIQLGLFSVGVSTLTFATLNIAKYTTLWYMRKTLEKNEESSQD